MKVIDITDINPAAPTSRRVVPRLGRSFIDDILKCTESITDRAIYLCSLEYTNRDLMVAEHAGWLRDLSMSKAKETASEKNSRGALGEWLILKDLAQMEEVLPATLVATSHVTEPDFIVRAGGSKGKEHVGFDIKTSAAATPTGTYGILGHHEKKSPHFIVVAVAKDIALDNYADIYFVHRRHAVSPDGYRNMREEIGASSDNLNNSTEGVLPIADPFRVQQLAKSSGTSQQIATALPKWFPVRTTSRQPPVSVTAIDAISGQAIKPRHRRWRHPVRATVGRRLAKLTAQKEPSQLLSVRYLFSHEVPKDDCKAGYYLAWLWNEFAHPGTSPTLDRVAKGMATWLLARRACVRLGAEQASLVSISSSASQDALIRLPLQNGKIGFDVLGALSTDPVLACDYAESQRKGSPLILFAVFCDDAPRIVADIYLADPAIFSNVLADADGLRRVSVRGVLT